MLLNMVFVCIRVHESSQKLESTLQSQRLYAEGLIEYKIFYKVKDSIARDGWVKGWVRGGPRWVRGGRVRGATKVGGIFWFLIFCDLH